MTIPEYDLNAALERMYNLKIRLRDVLDEMGRESVRYEHAYGQPAAPEWTQTALDVANDQFLRSVGVVLDRYDEVRHKVARWLVEKQRQHVRSL
jgi:hypothetical protein